MHDNSVLWFTMAPTRVLIIGGGIAGPVLGLFLKIRGYDAIVFERLPHFVDLGVGLMYAYLICTWETEFRRWCRLQANGLKVLSLIPGLVDTIKGRDLEAFEAYSTLPGHESKLGESTSPVAIREKLGFSFRGVRRTTLHASLTDECKKQGVEVRWGYECTSFEQGEDSVSVKFANGETETGSFIVGCDGLHSVVRIGLFGKETASFTGLTQVSPDSLLSV
jgi:salicylate hydroxylase